MHSESGRVRTALYARVLSTDQGQTPDNQLVPLREYAARQGWRIVAEFVDEASGARAGRRALKAMLQAAARKQFDVLLFWSLDRLWREGARKTIELLDQLTRCGVSWRSYSEPCLDSAGPFGEALIALLSALARRDRLRLSERVRAGLERARQRGTRSGRPVGRPKVVFDRAEAVRLREAGWSWGRIARWLGISVAAARRAWESRELLPELCQKPQEELWQGHTEGSST